jgi:acetyl-CoA acyltransferase
MNNSSVIVSYGRSACSRAVKGPLAGVHPVEYAAEVLKGVKDKIPEIEAGQVEDVITGCSIPITQADWNTSRLIVNRAGVPDEVPAQTVNRFCASGLQTIATATNAIITGEMEIVMAGGVEDLTDCFLPYPSEFMNPWIRANYEGGYMAMGVTAERVAEKYGISRERMEEMAIKSHLKAHKAQSEGKLAPSILPVTGSHGEVFMEDVGIRPNTSMESLAQLKPSFHKDGRITAGTSSQVTDAAAYVLLMSERKAVELGLVPIARFLGFAITGCDPVLMGLGPVYAVPKVLKQVNLNLEEIDVIEINEAFASQVIACMDLLGLPEDKVNPYGGAIALGHPMGATGTILVCKALDFMKDTGGRYAMVTMCIGGGMGAAGIFELLLN